MKHYFTLYTKAPIHTVVCEWALFHVSEKRRS